MNRNGIDLPTLMRLARWGSNVVLRYLEDAPLSTLTLNYRRSTLQAMRGELAAQDAALTSADVERIVTQHFRAAAVERTSSDTSIEALTASVDSLATHFAEKHSSVANAVERTATQLGDIQAALAPKFALNIKTGKFHAIRFGMGFDHRQWRTACGTAFGARPDLYEVRTTLPDDDSAPLKCFNCFGLG